MIPGPPSEPLAAGEKRARSTPSASKIVSRAHLDRPLVELRDEPASLAGPEGTRMAWLGLYSLIKSRNVSRGWRSRSSAERSSIVSVRRS